MLQRTVSWILPPSIALLVLLLCLAIPSSLLAQPGDARVSDGRWARSFNGFALVCRSLGMEFATDSDAWKRQPAEQRVLVVFGDVVRWPVDEVVEFVNEGGALLFATDAEPDFVVSFEFVPGPLRVANSANGFGGHSDCPIIKDRSTHPVMQGVDQIAANLCGGIKRRSSSEWVSVARLPQIAGEPDTLDFAVTHRQEDALRVMACADQSIFTNQMLYHLDNARFALQTMNWLCEGKRTRLLFLVDGRVVSPDDPQAVDVQFPQPTPEQVWDALRNLPPDVMLQVGNEIATLIEDENLVNEVMSLAMKDVSDQHMTRAVIFLTTLLLGGFLFYRYMTSESTLQDATGTDTKDIGLSGTGWFGKRRKDAGDRHSVARELVGRFYSQVSKGKHNHYVGFPAGLTFVNCENEQELRKGMKQTAKYLKWKSRRWWTQARLQGLREQINYWEYLVANDQLVCDAGVPLSEETPG